MTNNAAVTNLASITFSNTAGSYTFSGTDITLGSGGLANNSTNAQTISTTLTLGATETFTAGSGSLILAGLITNAGKTLTLSGASNTKITGVLSGAGGLTGAGTGTLILSGANLFTGGVNLSSGSLLLEGGDNRLWTNSSLTLSAGTTVNLSTNSQQLSSVSGAGMVTGSSGTLTIATTNAVTFNGSVTGGLSLAKNGGDTLTLGGSNSYSGGTTINAGTLVLGSANALGASTNSLAVSGTLNLGSRTITQGSVTLSGGTISGGTLSATNVALQGGSISANLTGSTGVTQSSGTSILAGSNSFTGGATVNGGTLVASNASALAGGSVSVNGGTLNLGSIAERVTSVSLGNGTITGSGLLTESSFTATNTGTALVTESFGGSGGFFQNGAGTTTLTGSNSFIGGTLVNAGTLVASNTNALGASNAMVTVAGGNLDLAGISQKFGSVTLTSGSITDGTVIATSGVTVNGTNPTTIGASLGGTGGLIKSGSGTLSLNTQMPVGSVSVASGTLQSISSVVGAAVNTSGTVRVGNGGVWTNGGLMTVGGSGNGTLTVSSGGAALSSGVLIASNSTSRGTVILGDSNGVGNLSLGGGTVTFGAGNGNLIFNQSGQTTLSNQIVSSSPGKGTITSSGRGTTTISGNNSTYSGTTYLNSGTVVLGANANLGGSVNIAGKSSVLALNANSSLSGNGATAVAGLLLDNSGQAFTSSIRGSVVLAPTGVLQKTYSGGSSVAGFGAGIGAGKKFSILAGTVTADTTLSASLVSGSLNFKGTFNNPAVLSITDPSFSAIKNTIQWYNPITSKWVNTIQGNGQGGAAPNVTTSAITSMLGTTNAKLWGSSGFRGSFNTFLIDVPSLNLPNGLASLNALGTAMINTDLLSIMGAYGYDSTTHSAWAVIDHNSLFSGGGSGITSGLRAAALNDAGVVADLSVFNGSQGSGSGGGGVQVVPEPGTWGLIILGVMVLLVAARAKRRVIQVQQRSVR